MAVSESQLDFMRELLVIQVKGSRYGIWKDAVLSVKDVESLHRLPLAPACIAGISIIDGRTVMLADLPACIGYDPGNENRAGRMLVLSGQEKISGFLVYSDIDSLAVPQEAVVPLPDYIKTDAMHTCVVHEDGPVPIIDVFHLQSHILKEQDPPRPSLIVPRADRVNSAALSSARVFRLGNELYALSSPGVEEQTIPPARIAGMPLVPQFIKGITCHEGAILQVVDLSQRIRRKKAESGNRVLIQKINGAGFGLLIEEDRGTVPASEFTVASLPPIAGSAWLNHAVIIAGQIVPLVDPSLLLSINAEVSGERRRETKYTPTSQFPALFKKQDTDVVEFSLLGARHALPKSEIEDVVDFRPYRRIPEAPPIVVGVAEHNGLLLPVLDLALVFGRRSLVSTGWRMMLVKNGDFRALVITESFYGDRRLPLDIQRTVPIRLPHHVVYGCYPDADAVRLILNVEALAVHFEKSLVKELMSTMPQEMKRAPAELVPSLLDEHASAPEYKTMLLSASLSAAPKATTPAFTGIAASLQKNDGETADLSGAIQKEAEREEKSAEAQEPQAGAPVYPSEVLDKSQDLEQDRDASETSAESVPTGTEGNETAAKESKDYTIAPSGEVTAVSEKKSEKELSGQTGKALGSTPVIQPEDVEKTSAAACEERGKPAEERKDEAAVPSEEGSVASDEIIEEGTREEAETFREQETPVDSDRTVAASAGTTLADQLPTGTTVIAARSSGEEVKPGSASGIQSRSQLQHDTVVKPAFEPETKPELQSAMREMPAVMASETQGFEQEKEIRPEMKRERVERVPGGHEEVNRPVLQAAERLQYTPAGDSWKRKIGIGALTAAVLAGIVYGISIYNRPRSEKSANDKVPLGIEQVKDQSKATPVKKQKTPLVLEIPAAKSADHDVYVVVKGDTLWDISERFTGNPFNYPRIAGENRIANPDFIFPGQKITLKKK